MERIYQQKKTNKKILARLRNDYLAIVFSGLCKRESIRKIHKDIRKITEAYKHKFDFVSSKLETYCKKLAVKTDKDMLYVGLSLLAIGDEIAKAWSKNKVFNDTNKLINEKVRKEEEKGKEKAIKDFIRQCREKKEIFFLCSEHDDSAEDHRDWQGKLYVDSAWQKDIFFKANIDKIRQFIQSNNIRTFQWVTHRPVWLITRPNCRHYFVSLTYAEVKNHSVSELISKYNLHSTIGQRQYQPIWHPINQGWYTKENVESIIQKYRERLDMHERIYKQVKSDELKRMIAKDKLLLNKWLKFYANM